jgi:Glycosyl transferase family 2
VLSDLKGSSFCVSNSGENRISVALCTYNGAQFLSKQLASIQRQTRLPDELVVCDDLSTDSTMEILRDFAESVSFPVRVIQNEQNLGSARNFEQAIRLCRGDLVALCDQDDIWYPTRLERSEQELTTHPEAGLVFSDADLIDDQDRLLGSRLWPTFQFTEKSKRQLLAGEHDLCVKSRFVTGATVMFRTNLRTRCLPVAPGWIHDEWIVATSAVFSDLRPVDEPLICYRKHASQQLGTNLQVSTLEKAREFWSMMSSAETSTRHWNFLSRRTRNTQTLCDTLALLSLNEREWSHLSSYQIYMQFLTSRSNLPRRRMARLYPVIRNFSQYLGLGESGWKDAMKDLLLSR